MPKKQKRFADDGWAMQKIGSMKVINVCEEVMEVFEMTGFADILIIE